MAVVRVSGSWVVSLCVLSSVMLFPAGEAGAQSASQAAHSLMPGPFTVSITSAADNKPAGGVVVTLGGRMAATNAAGQVVFDGVPAGEYPLSISHPETELFDKKVSLAEGKRDPMPVVLKPVKLFRVEGRIVAAGSGHGITGAAVRLSPETVPCAVKGSLLFNGDWAGAFVIGRIPPGTYKCEVSAPGYVGMTEQREVREGAALEFRLAREIVPATLTVKVENALTGAAVSNATVQIAESWPLGIVASAQTGADGTAQLANVPTGRANWIGAGGEVAAIRRAATVGVKAQGHESAVVPVILDGARQATVRVNPVTEYTETEPNNDAASAQALHLGADVRFMISAKKDQDWFRFSVRQRTYVKATVAKGNPLAAHLGLIGANGRTVTDTWNYAGSGIEVAAWLDPGDFYARVAPNNPDEVSDKPFLLSLRGTETVDVFEPNDTVQDARRILAGEEVRGVYAPAEDRDFFRLEMPRPGAIRTVLAPHPLVQHVKILAANGAELASTWNYEKTTCTLEKHLPAGTYVIVADANGQPVSTSPYSMRVELIEDDGSDDSALVSGSIAAARTLAANSLQGYSLWPIGDIDRFAIPVPRSGRIKLLGIAPIHLNLELQRQDGTVLNKSWQYPGQLLDLPANVDSPGVVYAVCKAQNGDEASPSPCIIQAAFEPNDDFEPYERNDLRSMATPFEVPETLHGCLSPAGETDRFCVDVDHPGILSVESIAPVHQDLIIYDSRNKELASTWQYPGSKLVLSPEVYPGEHQIVIRPHSNEAHAGQFQIQVQLLRAEPCERVPLALDPIRQLQPGIAQSWAADHANDVDRFTLSTAAAGKFAVIILSNVHVDYLIRDMASGQKIQESWNYPGRTRLELETKGPTRYRLDLKSHNGEKSPRNGYVLVTQLNAPEQELPAEVITSEAEPTDPAQVTFQRTAWKDAGKVSSIALDPDSNGRIATEVSGSGQLRWRYPAPGLYRSTLWLTGAGGVKTRSEMWVEALGCRERKGIQLSADFPAEGQVIEQPAPVNARAVSYTGARIARVTFDVDGKTLQTAYTSPFTAELAWDKLDASTHTLTVTAWDGSGAKASLERHFRVSDYYDMTPTDGAVVTGQNVRASWTARDYGPAQIRFRPQEGTTWTEAAGDPGMRRTVVLDTLEAGKAYEIQPLGGGEPGPVRTVTRVKGLAFGRARYGANINRDYNQKVPISVRNHGDKALTVRLECGKPEDATLLVGFVGEGSEGAPFDLAPGEERDFHLGISAQDVTAPLQRFPVRLRSETGLSDEAEVELTVKMPDVKFAWQHAGRAPQGIGEVYRLVNNGDGVSDLRVDSSTSDVLVSPSIRHGMFLPGASLEITAMPRMYEGFSKAEAVLTAQAAGKQFTQPVTCALASGEQASLINLIAQPDSSSDPESTLTRAILEARAIAGAYLQPDSVDWSRREAPEDLDSDGRPDRWRVVQTTESILWIGDDTDRDGEVDFVHADIGPDGQFEYSAFKTKTGWERTNIVEAWLETAFTLPWSRESYEKHDVDVVVNDVVVGQLRDTIPEGNYTFRVPPSILRFSAQGYPENNSASIRSKHLRGGHYVVNSDFRLRTRLTATSAWAAGKTEDEARARAGSASGFSVSGPDYSVSSAEVTLDKEIKPGTPVTICVPVRNLGATSTREMEVALMTGESAKSAKELVRVSIEPESLLAPTLARLTWAPSAGRHTLRIVVDPDGNSGDSNRKNNEACLNVVAAAQGAKPAIKLLEPADGATLKDPVCNVKIEASSQSGVSRIEGSIDGGLFQEVAVGHTSPYGARCLLQPGQHRITLRAVDEAGNSAEAAVKVTAETKAPSARIKEPADGTKISASTALVTVEVPDNARCAALRVDGGPWLRARTQGQNAIATVPLREGRRCVEAMVVDEKGTAGFTSTTLECTASGPSPQDRTAAPGNSGEVEMPGAGTVDFFGELNTFIGARNVTVAAATSAPREAVTTAPTQAPRPWATAEARQKTSAAKQINDLKSPKAQTRLLSAVILGMRRDRAAIDPLIELADKDADLQVRSAAIMALGSYAEPKAVERVVGLASDANAEVRLAAIAALAGSRDNRTSEALARACTDKDPKVSEAAMQAYVKRLLAAERMTESGEGPPGAAGETTTPAAQKKEGN